jgi:hypothetical protein
MVRKDINNLLCHPCFYSFHPNLIEKILLFVPGFDRLAGFIAVAPAACRYQVTAFTRA